MFPAFSRIRGVTPKDFPSRRALPYTQPVEWAPKFLCDSIRGPIILSDGRVTTCTLDHEGQNEIGNIHEHDFETIVERFAATRLSAMADPISKPMCYKCYTKLPRWKDSKVPRADWINLGCSTEKRDRFLGMFDPENLRINLELSSKCNLRCIGCSVAKPEFKYTRRMPNIDLETFRQWVGGHARRISHVRLYHMGETWLHPEWAEICRFLKTENPAVTLFTSTNGMPLQIGNTVEKIIESGIDHVMFSMHGASQESTEKYMGRAFRLDVALAMATKLAALRRQHGTKLYLSWKYLIFTWNDSDDELARAKRFCDEAGFDEINFSITSQPSPSRRFAKGTPHWTAFQNECASLWKRAEDYQRTAPMTALYPGERHRGLRTEPFLPELTRTEIREPTPCAAPPTFRDRVHRKAAVLLQKHFTTRAIKSASADALAGRPLETAARLKRATLFGAPPETYYRLGEAQLAMRDHAGALKTFETLLALQGANASEFHHLGHARALRGLERWVDARHACETAIQRRLQAKPRAYGEDIYLELSTVMTHLGHEVGARTAYRLWQEESYVRNDRSPASIYCPIPKNACTYLKTALAHNSLLGGAFRESKDDAHRFLREPGHRFSLRNRDLFTQSKYFRFVVLRNPFTRLASAYANLFVRPLKWHALPDPSVRSAVFAIQHRLGRRLDATRSATFEELVRHVAVTADFDLDYHLRPQSAFFERLENFDFVGRFEDLAQVRRVLEEKLLWTFEGVGEFNRTDYRSEPDGVRHHRTSPHELRAGNLFPPATALFTTELRDLVLERYAADFAIYREVFGVEATLD